MLAPCADRPVGVGHAMRALASARAHLRELWAEQSARRRVLQRVWRRARDCAILREIRKTVTVLFCDVTRDRSVTSDCVHGLLFGPIALKRAV